MASEQYDYIIVGAGSAGCVVASQLIKRANAKVLLLEAGSSDNNLFMKMPAGLAKIPASNTWSYTTEPEPHANNRCLPIPQGKVLGGSSTINGMVYIRGQKEDYDEWENQYGCQGWGYQDVLPYFKRAEANESLANRYHGNDGPLHVSENRHRHPLSTAFIRAGQELDIPYVNDFNGESQYGVGFYQTTTHQGERASTSRTYLQSVTHHPNLTLKLKALVHRVIIENGAAVGVIYSTKEGKEVKAYASKEVVLSAGALGSPKILMLSGIGPKQHLEQMNIPLVADLPVGKNFHDHMHLSINVSTKQPISLFGADKGLRAASYGLEWLAFRRGPVASNILEGGAFVDTCGQGRPDIQIHFLPLLDDWDNTPGVKFKNGHGFTLKVGHLQPKSRGEVQLTSSKPQDMVKIRANYLADPQDVAGCIRAVKLGLSFLDTKAFKPLIKELLLPEPQWINDEEKMESFVREFSKTVYHPVGTCRMGRDTASSVTDLTLKVHGIAGLRVVDCSVFPSITSGNTNAPTIMLAEKAVDLILQQDGENSNTQSTVEGN